jgi:hypothetical protein
MTYVAVGTSVSVFCLLRTVVLIDLDLGWYFPLAINERGMECRWHLRVFTLCQLHRLGNLE